MYARIVRWFPDQTVLKQKGKTGGEEKQHAKGLKCRDRRHIGHDMGKIHEEEQRWDTVTRELRRKRISRLLWWEEKERRLCDRTKEEGGRIRDIFIWHATRLHPSFINWRSQEWAWQTAPGQTYMYAPHVLCLSPLRPRSLNPSALNYPFPPLFSTSRGNGKWGFAISLTFEHSSLSRSRPQREICLCLPFSHPIAFPIVASRSLLYRSCKSPSSYSILQV